MASCGLLQLAVAGCGWLQVAMVGQRLAMAGWAWQRLAKMCLLLSNTARVGDEGVSQVGRPDRRSKRGEYRPCVVRHKTGGQGHVHGVELDFRKMWELVSHFSKVV